MNEGSHCSTSSPALGVVCALGFDSIQIGAWWCLAVVLICFPWGHRKRSMFPVPLHRLRTFLGEVSIAVFCLLFNWVASFLIVEFCVVFFACLGWEIVVVMPLEDFLPVCGLPILSLSFILFFVLDSYFLHGLCLRCHYLKPIILPRSSTYLLGYHVSISRFCILHLVYDPLWASVVKGKSFCQDSVSCRLMSSCPSIICGNYLSSTVLTLLKCRLNPKVSVLLQPLKRLYHTNARC